MPSDCRWSAHCGRIEAHASRKIKEICAVLPGPMRPVRLRSAVCAQLRRRRCLKDGGNEHLVPAYPVRPGPAPVRPGICFAVLSAALARLATTWPAPSFNKAPAPILCSGRGWDGAHPSSMNLLPVEKRCLPVRNQCRRRRPLQVMSILSPASSPGRVSEETKTVPAALSTKPIVPSPILIIASSQAQAAKLVQPVKGF